MAGRPKRQTVDFFPHYVKWGKTLQILESRYGNDGYAVWFKTLQILGDTEGHYFCAGNTEICAGNTEEWEFLLSKLRVSEDLAIEIYDLLARINTIDRDLWEKHRVIWCQNFVDGLNDVYRKRSISAPERPIFSAEIPITDTENTQRRGEERRGEKRREDNKGQKNQREINYQEIIDLYHKLCPSLPKVRGLSVTRKKSINSIFKSYDDPIELLREIFTKSELSDFISGRIQGRNGHENWKADFGWLLKPDNRIKIIEGKYDNQNNGHKNQKGVFNGNQSQTPNGAFDGIES